jgi:hypothetical protein
MLHYLSLWMKAHLPLMRATTSATIDLCFLFQKQKKNSLAKSRVEINELLIAILFATTERMEAQLCQNEGRYPTKNSRPLQSNHLEI